MEDFAIDTLWVTELALPVLLFLVANDFRHAWLTWIRAVVAIGYGWALGLSYAVAAKAIPVCFAQSQVRILEIYESDGAPVAFATTLGWVLPAMLVFMAWGVRVALAKRRKPYFISLWSEN